MRKPSNETIKKTLIILVFLAAFTIGAIRLSLSFNNPNIQFHLFSSGVDLTPVATPHLK